MDDMGDEIEQYGSPTGQDDQDLGDLNDMGMVDPLTQDGMVGIN